MTPLADAVTRAAGHRVQRATPIAGVTASGVAATAHAGAGVIAIIAVTALVIPEVFWLAALLFACWERRWILTHLATVEDERTRQNLLERDPVATTVRARAEARDKGGNRRADRAAGARRAKAGPGRRTAKTE